MTVTLVSFAIMLGLVVLGVPLAFSMLVVGLLGFAYLRGIFPAIDMVGQTITSGAMNYEFSVIPLFLLMGGLLYRAEISSELYRACFMWLGAMRGGLAMATIGASALFSAVSGTSVATAATMARVAMPEMRRYKYHDTLAAGSIAAGGTLGILIPPSVPLLLYGIMTQESIGELFIAGIIPGLIGVLGYLLVIHILTRRNAELGPAGPRTAWRERMSGAKGVASVLLLFVIVLGGIYAGIFTPTEAGAVGAAGALALTVVRGRFGIALLADALAEASATTIRLLFIGFGALVFSNVVELSGMPRQFVGWIGDSAFSPEMVMFAIIIFYIVMGFIFEPISLILLTVPIFAPLVSHLGYDLIWFGIIVVVTAEIGMLTPPIGLNVFVVKSVTSDLQLSTIYRGVTPFWIADIIRLALLATVPWLVLVLPGMMR